MSKRNLILLIIVLVFVTICVFVFLSFYQPKNKTSPVAESINFLANFLPFGENKKINNSDSKQPVDISGYEPSTENTTENKDLKLKKVSSFPVAGFGIIMKERFKDIPDPTPNTETQNTTTDIKTENKNKTDKTKTKPVTPPTEFIPILRYVNRIDGNIYQTFIDKIEGRKFSSTVIPKVYEAYLGNNGESVVMRYLKEDNETIETFLGTLPKEYLGADFTGTSELKGSFLPENITDVSMSPDTTKMFYLFNTNNSVAGITLSFPTSTKTQVFDSPFTEWLSFWPNNKIITLTTKPSSTVKGYMYSVDVDKKDFNKVLGGINGLTTLTSPNGKIVLYADNTLSLNLFDINTSNSTLVGIKTLPEKCVWGNTSDVIFCAVPKYIDSGEYPDVWYQGEVSFSDDIWKIDVKTGNTELVTNLTETEGGENIDAIKIDLDENQNTLFFINKKDSYLWALDLTR